MRTPLLAFGACLVASSLLHAQDYEAPGPHAVGWRDHTQPLVGGGPIVNRVFYPALVDGAGTDAEVLGGPYPLVGLIHGAGWGPDEYDVLCTHVASWGYVVASLGDIPPAVESVENMASEMHDLLRWMELQDGLASSPYFELVSDDAWSVIGSSKGGGASEHVVGLEPRIRNLALLEPLWVSTPTALASLGAWTGSGLFVAGEVDQINPPAEVQAVHDSASKARRRAYVEILGAGHFGAIDEFGPIGAQLPHAQQNLLHRALVTGFLEAEVRGREDAYHRILGTAVATDPFVQESTCVLPPFWVVEQHPGPGTLTLGLGGAPGDVAVVASAASPASIPTPFGLLGLEPATTVLVGSAVLDGSGVLELEVPLPPGAGSPVAFPAQSIVVSSYAVLSRTDLVTVP